MNAAETWVVVKKYQHDTQYLQVHQGARTSYYWTPFRSMATTMSHPEALRISAAIAGCHSEQWNT